MNQKQKDKFHKAIKDLTELLDELNQDIYSSYELDYSQAACTFKITKMVKDAKVIVVEQDDTYFPNFGVVE